MSSKTERRANEILRVLLTRGKTSVEDLRELFGTSIASVRRDLVRLEGQGLVHRTHGGAMLAGQTYEPFRFDASFHVREGRFAREKQRIAEAAAGLIEDGDAIGITAGTTTTQVARAIRKDTNLRVLTNAVNITMELSSRKNCETTLTGGCMRWSDSSSLSGPVAIEALSLFALDRLFLGVCGIDALHGATTIQADEAAVFRAMCHRTKQVIVVADSSKVGMVSPSVICPVGKIDTLITDDGITPAALAELQARGLRVKIA